MVQITTNSLTTWFLILLYPILVIREIASQPKAHGASSARSHAFLLSSASSALSAHLLGSTLVFFRIGVDWLPQATMQRKKHFFQHVLQTVPRCYFASTYSTSRS